MQQLQDAILSDMDTSARQPHRYHLLALEDMHRARDNLLRIERARGTLRQQLRRHRTFDADGAVRNMISHALIPRQHMQVYDRQPYDVRQLKRWVLMGRFTVPHSSRELTPAEVIRILDSN